MAKTAQAIGRRAAGRKPPLPPLLFFTDPQRTPDIIGAMQRLPRGSAVIYRAFGAADAGPQAELLLRAARRHGLKLLIGADAALAAEIGADGLHLPERMAMRARRLRRPGWMVTAAAHSTAAARRALAAGADAAVVSAVFPSASPSAGRPIGPLRLAQIARTAGGPIYGLGGINDKTARRLLPAGLVGLAAVEALA